MHKKQLEQALLQWSARETENSRFAGHDVSTRRAHQLGLILGLLSSVCEHDFYARNLVLKKLCLKD
jgi:hypothetical protein